VAGAAVIRVANDKRRRVNDLGGGDYRCAGKSDASIFHNFPTHSLTKEKNAERFRKNGFPA
jgi:hypothetical protein